MIHGNLTFLEVSFINKMQYLLIRYTMRWDGHSRQDLWKSKSWMPLVKSSLTKWAYPTYKRSKHKEELEYQRSAT